MVDPFETYMCLSLCEQLFGDRRRKNTLNMDMMGIVRYYHKAMNSEVILIGGVTRARHYGSYFNEGTRDCLVYNFTFNTVRKCAVESPVNFSFHGSAKLSDKSILVVGRCMENEPYYSPCCFRLTGADSSRKFTEVGGLMEARINAALVTLHNGCPLIFGGFIAGCSRITNTMEIYSPTLKSWSQLSVRMRPGLAGHCAVVLKNGNVLIIGGITHNHWPILGRVICRIYQFDTGRFKLAAYTKHPRHRSSAVLLPNGQVLVTGGMIYDDNRKSSGLASCEVYNPDTDSWLFIPNMIQGRHQHMTICVCDHVFVIGGMDRYDDAKMVDEKLCLASFTWTALPERMRTESLLGASLTLID